MLGSTACIQTLGCVRLRELTEVGAPCAAQVQPEAFEGAANPVEAVASLCQLTSLSLRESPVLAQHLPRWMQLEHLQLADLSGCELERVPACLYAASALRKLNLSRNGLTRMPAASQVGPQICLGYKGYPISCACCILAVPMWATRVQLGSGIGTAR